MSEASFSYTQQQQLIPGAARLAEELLTALWPNAAVTVLPRARAATPASRMQAARVAELPPFCQAVQANPERRKKCLDVMTKRWKEAMTTGEKVKASCHASTCLCGVTFPSKTANKVEGLIDLQAVRIDADGPDGQRVTLPSKSHSQRMKLDTLFRQLPLMTQDDYQHLSALVEALFERAAPDPDPAQPRRADEGFGPLAGRSPAARDLFDHLEAVAGFDGPLLMTGESGSGKTLAAEVVHRAGPRRERPWYTLDCRLLHTTKSTNELFGYKRGSGALRTGWLEFMSDGTLILKHIDAMPIGTQTLLGSALRDGAFLMMDTNTTVPLRCRVIATTTQDLHALVGCREFDANLCETLTHQSIPIPPLRERMSDLPLIVRELLGRHGKARGAVTGDWVRGWSAWAAKYPWPGNVAALRDALDAMLASGQDTPGDWMFWQAQQQPGMDLDLKFKLASLERDILRRTLAATGQDKMETARRMKIDEVSLAAKIKNYDLRQRHD